MVLLAVVALASDILSFYGHVRVEGVYRSSDA